MNNAQVDIETVRCLLQLVKNLLSSLDFLLLLKYTTIIYLQRRLLKNL